MANKTKKITKKKRPPVKNKNQKKKHPKKKHKFQKKYLLWLAYILLAFVIAVSIFHVFKILPHGVSKTSSETKTEHVELLTDVTYKSGDEMNYDQEIFEKVNETINEANDFIIMDMFLF
ncbi:MAG: hypothetical protein ACTH18_12255, partial [Mammaliicoccus vitulinus]